MTDDTAEAPTIRRAEPADADVLLGLIEELAAYEQLDPPSAEARARLVRDGFGPTPRFEAFLAEKDGEAQAYAILFPTYSTFLALPTLYLEDLFVRPAARGQGIGTALFRFLARHALDEGYGRMEWVVLDWNHPAIAFYERIGARRLREWLPYRLTRDQLGEVAERPGK